nr:polyprotein [Patatavirales sp.]
MRSIGVAPRYSPVTTHWHENPQVPTRSEEFVYSLEPGRELDTAIKYDVPDTVLCAAHVLQIRSYILSKLDLYCKFVHVPKSFWDLFGDVELGTTPGFLHSTRYHDKSQFFGDENVRAILREESPLCDFPWTGFSKEEVIRKNKKTRQITGCDARFLYHLLPLSHQFNHDIELKGRGLPFFLGSSMIGSDWCWFVHYFSDCHFFLTTDGKKFDSTVPSFLQWQCCEVRKRYLNERYHSALEALYDQVINKVIVEPDGKMFVATHGVPSGHPSTAHDNSLISWFQVMYGLLYSGVSFSWVDAHVRLAIYGDDVVIGFTELPPFNIATFKTNLRLAGLDPDCGDVFQSFHEIDFLSRKPVLYDGHYVPIMKRHEKLFAAMRFDDSSMTKMQRLSKYIQLREALAGTPRFVDACSVVDEELQSMSHLYASDPEFVRAKKLLYTEDQILRVRGGLPLKQAGLANKKDILPFLMSSKKEMKPRTSKPRASKQQQQKRHPRTPTPHPRKQQVQNKPRGPRRSAVSLVSTNNSIRPYLRGMSEALPIEGRDMLVKLTGNSNANAVDTRELVINPGHAMTFPKIFRIAANYRKFTYEYIRLRYVSAASAVTAGQFMAYADASAEIPISQDPTFIENRDLVSSCVLWESTALSISPKDFKNPLKEYFVKNKNDIDTYEAASNYALLNQCVPFWFGFGSLGASTTGFIGTIYLEYKFVLREFIPQINTSFDVTCNPYTPSTIAQSPADMPNTTIYPGGFWGTNNPIAGDVDSTSAPLGGNKVIIPKSAAGTANDIDYTNTAKLPDGIHVVSLHTQFAPTLTARNIIDKDVQRLHELRDQFTDNYWRQMLEGVDEKKPIYLRDLPIFAPDRVEIREDGSYYWDPVHKEWEKCPEPVSHRKYLAETFGFGAAGDTFTSTTTFDLVTGVGSVLYSYLTGSTSLVDAGKTLLVTVAKAISPVIGQLFSYTPSTLAPNRSRNYNTLSVTNARPAAAGQS